ncbi:mannose-1-phosphate guanylyltransferase/mannose-6-phosphate isomerase [Candidatus Gracilibacteria bacterium]|nr:mannose-1-phosphate guanylyltransferase/mannose-6-phosphate isomerase [Candidatus Gracilibacteria bacterium]
MKIYSIILAGGSGTRLWPISRKYYPKQFIKLAELGGASLFQNTLKRAILISKVEDILIATNIDYKYHCITQASEIGIKLKECQILIEPMAKNTLGAITFAMKNIENDSLGLILPSDQVIENEDKFIITINESKEIAQKSLITFGIKPFCPHTGYGYINPILSKETPYKVKEFKEKPNKETAKKFINNGYLWNSGIFLFGKEIFFSELKKHSKAIFDIFERNEQEIYSPYYGYEQTAKGEEKKSNSKLLFEKEKYINEAFNALPDLSIDYGLLEKSNNIYVTPLDTYWNDLGSFDSIDEYLKEKKWKNNNLLEVDAKNNFFIGEIKDKKVAVIGLDDCIIIDTKDALLVSKKGESQKIKDVVNILKEENKQLVNFGQTVYRPWGSYTIIDEGTGFKTKRITVLNNKKLSLQMHYHRSEHWVVVDGTAVVTVGEEEKIVRKGESVFIPSGFKHRLENKGKTELHIIESQIGDYLEEDDIVRFDDDFGRK